jgi:hypothetical protein
LTASCEGSASGDGCYGFLLFWLLPLWVAVTAFAATPRDGGLA